MADPDDTPSDTEASDDAPPEEVQPVESASTARRGAGIEVVHAGLGLLPLTAWMVLQLVLYAKVHAGPCALADAFSGWLDLTRGSGFVVLAVLALGLHAGLGLWIKATMPARAPQSGGRAQLISGILTFALVLLHLRLVGWALHTGELPAEHLHSHVTALLATTHAGVPLIALGYLFGFAACTYHLGNGIWRLGSRLRWRQSQAAERAGLFVGLGSLVLFLWGAYTIVHIATGWSPVHDVAVVGPHGECNPPAPSDDASASPTAATAAPSAAPR